MELKNKEIKRIIGIDPGTNVMGYGVIDSNGKGVKLISMGVIKTDKLSSHYDKLRHLTNRIDSLMKMYKPDIVAFESSFVDKNIQTTIKLGRVQGVVIAATSAYSDVTLFEYAPMQIKKAIAGNGAASKEQVAFLLKQMFKLTISPKYMDATDGLATAICHHLLSNSPLGATSSKGNNWEAFLNRNPNRIKKS